MTIINKTLIFTSIFLVNSCSKIIDILPPEIKVNSPKPSQKLMDEAYLDLDIDDHFDIEKINIYTITKFGNTYKEIDNLSTPYTASIPIWTRSIEKIKIKAWDVNDNFSESEVNISHNQKYDIDFENDDDWREFNYGFSQGFYHTSDDSYSGDYSILFYSYSNYMTKSKFCRDGTVSFAYRRGTGCYYNVPSIKFQVDGITKWQDLGGFEAADDSWYRVDVSVGKGQRTFRWDFTHTCSNYDFLLIDAIYFP